MRPPTTDVRNAKQAIAELLDAASRSESAYLSCCSEEAWQDISLGLCAEIENYQEIERSDAPNEFWGEIDGTEVRGYMSIDG
jgi:hypothetical protein